MNSESVDRRFLLGGLAGAAGVSALAAMTKAGPLTPPAGAIGSSGKTLQDLADKIARTDAGMAEPRTPINASTTPGDATSVFKISVPGSYYLTTNLPGVSGKMGIKVACDNVTIDLNGFLLQGINGSLAAIGHDGPGNYMGIVIRNGLISGWSGDGISFPMVVPTNSRGYRIEGVRAYNNGGIGFYLGEAAVLIGCEASTNFGVGFWLGNHAVLHACVASGNSSGAGFNVGTGSSLVGCVARSNNGHGFYGLDSTFSACTATFNGSDGFSVTRSNIEACTAASNAGWGFNTTDSLITRSQARGNNDGGITCGSNTTVIQCVTAGGSPGSIGIHAAGNHNRIEGNTVMNHTTGVSVSGVTNLVVGNGASGNSATAYSIGAGNGAGPIVAAIGTISTSVPTANFAF